jgi:hypothetical protein
VCRELISVFLTYPRSSFPSGAFAGATNPCVSMSVVQFASNPFAAAAPGQQVAAPVMSIDLGHPVRDLSEPVKIYLERELVA